MLTAKLFGALAGLAAVLALPRILRPSLGVKWFSNGTYSGISPQQLWIVVALVSAAFALTYFAVARWSPRTANGYLSLGHFVSTAAGISLISFATAAFGGMSLALKGHALYVATLRMAGSPALSPWPMLALRCGLWSLTLGCLAFLSNLVVTTIRVLR
jgi:hypothetical protein